MNRAGTFGDSSRRWLGRAAFLAMLILLVVWCVQDTTPSWAQPHQNGLRDTIDTPVPTPTKGPTSTSTVTPGPCVQRVLLQQGVAGYAGTQDTWINAWEPDEPQRPYVARTGVLKLKGSNAWSVLVKFDLEGQVPAGAQILQAELVFYVEGGTRIRALDVAAYRLLRAWNLDWATWRRPAPGQLWSVAGADGPNQDRVQEPDDTITMLHRAVYRGFDVTDSVRLWLADPAKNYGWLLKGVSASTGEFNLLSSLWGSAEIQLRPVLRIDYNACSTTATPTFTPTASTTPTRTPLVTATPSRTPTQGQGLIAVVYEDTNRNGIRDPQEGGIAGATVRLLELSGSELDSQITAGAGVCNFGERPAGEYRLQEINAPGYFSSTDDQVRIYHGGGQTIVTFGDYPAYRVLLPVILKGPAA